MSAAGFTIPALPQFPSVDERSALRGSMRLDRRIRAAVVALHTKKNAQQLLDVAAERERPVSAFEFKHKSVPGLPNLSRVDDAFMEWGISRSVAGVKI
jgi:hypothetical protein